LQCQRKRENEMKGTQRFGFTLLVALVGSILFFTPDSLESQNLTMEKVVDNLYVIYGAGGNVGVFITKEGVILVDDKFEQHVPVIIKKVKTITDQPVRYVINTHHHGDHVGGNPSLLNTSEIIAHRNARKNMVNKSQPGLPRVTFNQEAAIFLGGQEVRIYHFGSGHTNGDLVVHFPAQKVIHSGDLFVKGNFFVDYASGGSSLEWDKAFLAMLELEFNTVIPGHGQVANRNDVIQQKKDFAIIRQRIQKIIQQGGSPNQAVEQLKLDDLPGWKFTNLMKRSLEGLFNELAE